MCLFCLMVAGPALAEKTITIGCPLPLTGPYASDGEQMKMALELAVAEKNAAGGVLGHQIKLKFGDVGGLEAEKIKAIGERLVGRGSMPSSPATTTAAWTRRCSAPSTFPICTATP